MGPNTMDSEKRAARAKQQDRFTRRRRSFMKKAHELHSKCDAEVYIVIRHNLRFYTYKASPIADWPPPQRSIDDSYPLPEQMTPETFEEKGSATEKTAKGGDEGSEAADAQEAGVGQEPTQRDGQQLQIGETDEPNT